MAGAGLVPLVVIILGFVNLFADGASRYLSISVGASVHVVSRGYWEAAYYALCTFASFFIFGTRVLGFSVIESSS